MFERLLAKKYIFQQKRHSILTICSIMTALALMTALFTLFSTVFQCLRDVEYDNNPWHYKITTLTKDKAESLLTLPEFDCNFVIEKDYTCSVELLLKEYTEYDYLADDDGYWAKLDIDRQTQLQVNNLLIDYDMITLKARASAVQIFAFFYVFVIFLALALRLVIDTAFEVSSKERERQFGVLQSIGATPQQIVRIITYEGLFLSCIGVPLGLLAGIGIGNVAFRAILTSGIAEAFLHDGQEALLHYHINPVLVAVAGITGLAWVLFSAYGTGMRIIKMSPIQAISNRSNKIMKVRKHSLFGLVFGWQGRFASRNNRRQPKRFVITVLSLTLSMMLFASVSYIMDVAHKQTDKIFDEIFLGIEFDIMADVHEKPGSDGMPVTIQKIEESGYFKNICYDISRFGKNGKTSVLVDYVNEATYLRQFKNEPPISYEELKQSGGYLYSSGTEFSGDAFTIQQMFRNGKLEDTPLTFPVVCKSDVAPLEKQYLSTDGIIWLYAPIEFYENSEIRKLYADEGINYSFTAFLNDTREHDEALDFLKSLDTVNTEEITDAYLEHRKADTVYSAIEIGFTFLNIMFTLIAVFNMVNIISTGILNRKSEFASLQCIGMTRGQLYGMTVLECLQYAVTSGALALGLCEALLWLTQRFLLLMQVYDDSGEAVVSMKKVINYSAPVPKILIAMLFAFAVAYISSLIPLKTMEKIPLTDQIRSVD